VAMGVGKFDRFDKEERHDALGGKRHHA